MTFCRWLVLTVLLATTVGCDDLAGSRSALGPGELREIGIEQKIGDAVPLDASFTDAAGRPVTLGRLLGERPVILALVYNRCPMLCNQVLSGLLASMKILERGAEHRPFDGEIWLNLGQFVSFVAPASYIEDHDPEMAQRWRREGVAYLARAAELGAENSNISWQALGGANILVRSGEREAAIRFLKRTYAVTDDEELKANILGRLERLLAERDLERYRRREEAFQKTFRAALPFLSRNQALVLGPPARPAECAGGDDTPACATTWRQWATRFDEEEQP